MKNFILIAGLMFSFSMTAQTKVVKMNAVKSNNFGVAYSLPLTTFTIDAEVTKITSKAGPYYKYAEKYLGVKDVITEDKVVFQLDKVTLENFYNRFFFPCIVKNKKKIKRDISNSPTYFKILNDTTYIHIYIFI